MKIAILGSSPLALEAALRFHAHGASLTWFRTEDVPELSLMDSASFAGTDFSSELGTGFLREFGKTYAPKAFSWAAWREGYEAPLIQFLRERQIVRGQEVVSVTKRFLSPSEEIPGKSRFYDLFRVIYLVNPARFISQQKENDPELYQKLSQELVGSLQSTIEMYEDFDLVLDARLCLEGTSLATTGRALGEARVTSAKVITGLPILRELPALASDTEVREMALVGSGSLAAEILIKLEEWLKDARNRLFLITTEEEPFATLTANPSLKKKLGEVMEMTEKQLQDDYSDFHKKLREWQELDDFVQVKKPRPAEPIPQLNFFSGHNVTAIDELIDRKRLFLTLERPDFRQGKKHPENNLVDLKTIGVDRILAANPMIKKNITPHLRHPEKGYFDVDTLLPAEISSWGEELKKIEGIEDEVFKLFSPASHH